MSGDLQEIELEIASLQKKKQAILDSKRATVLEETRTNVRLYGFTSAELGFGKISGAPVKSLIGKEAKYANPENTSQTWHGGKGPKPHWVKAHLENGGNLDSILIKK